MKRTLKSVACAAAVAVFALAALLFASGPKLSYASSNTKNLAVLFTNDTMGYLEACG